MPADDLHLHDFAQRPLCQQRENQQKEDTTKACMLLHLSFLFLCPFAAVAVFWPLDKRGTRGFALEELH